MIVYKNIKIDRSSIINTDTTRDTYEAKSST